MAGRCRGPSRGRRSKHHHAKAARQEAFAVGQLSEPRTMCPPDWQDSRECEPLSVRAPLGFSPGCMNSARTGGTPSITTVWTTPLSTRKRSPKLASQMRVAFSSIARKIRSSSPDGELTILNTSDVAACRSSASSSSRVSRATSFSSRAPDTLDFLRRFALVVGLRGFADLPLAAGRLRIALPIAHGDHRSRSKRNAGSGLCNE